MATLATGIGAGVAIWCLISLGLVALLMLINTAVASLDSWLVYWVRKLEEEKSKKGE